MIEQWSVTILVDNRATGNGFGAEHGLSFRIEADGYTLLFDTGQSDLMFHNAALAEINPANVDALLLSHGHYDHTGGVAGLLELRPDLPVYCHPGVVIPRYSRQHDGSMKPVGMSRLSERALMQSEKTVTWVSRPRYVTSHIGITGVIPRVTSFEDAGGEFFLDPAGVQPDPIEDDVAVWIETVDGIVVITGCCHSGIVNTVSYIRQLVGDEPLHRIVGGLHLVNASPERLDATAGYLRSISWNGMVPCHCTGENAVESFCREFPGRVEQGYAGKIIR